MNSPLRVAAAQFPVAGDLQENLGHIVAQMGLAAEAGAHVVQFPETALPGYGPRHLATLEGYRWNELERATETVKALAASLGIWVVLGTMRQVDEGLPRICLLIMSDAGEVVATYDKRELYHSEVPWFSPGEEPCVVSIRGVKCGFLICYENCFPKLYDAYRRLGVGLVFHSFYNAANRRETSIRHLMRSTMIVRAADNGVWISVANSSTHYCPLAACVVRPDGSSVSAERHVSGLAVDDYHGVKLGWTYDVHGDAV